MQASFHRGPKISTQDQTENWADVVWGHIKGEVNPALGRLDSSPAVVIIILLKGVDQWNKPLSV